MTRPNVAITVCALALATLFFGLAPSFLAATTVPLNRNGYMYSAPTPSLAAQVAALNRQVAALTNVVRVGPQGVTISAPAIVLNAQQALTLQAGGASRIVMNGGSTDIEGPMVKLNGGGSPVLTANEPQGSPTVWAN